MTHGAYILARYSTDNQSEASIETQVEHCSTWCKKNNLSILDIFADYAVSGMKSTRPQYERMMGLLRQGGADTVVIYDQSRMFRNMIAWFQFREELDSMGVRVVSVTQPTVGGDLNDPANFLNEGVFALFNQMHVLQTKQKTIAGVRHRAQQGKHTGGTPALGYRVENERLVVDEAEAAIVRQIFKRYAAGETYGQILSALNQQGLTTKRGTPFVRNSLHDLLKNEKYIGRAVFGGKPVAKDGSRNAHAERSSDCIVVACPAIVDQETWNIVRKRMEGNRHVGRNPEKVEQPLKGKIFCGDCDSAMTLSVSVGGKAKARYYYYKCAAKKRGLDCPSLQIRKDELEQLVSDSVRSQLGTPAAKDRLLGILQQQRDKMHGTAAPQLAKIQKQIREIDRQLENASSAVLAGLHSETLINKVAQLEVQRADLRAQAKSLNATIKGAALDVSKLDALLTDLISQADEYPAAIFATVLRVEVYSDTIKIWTIFDPEPDKKSDTPEVTKHNVNTIVPIPAAAMNCVEGMVPHPAYQSIYAKWLIVAFPARRLRRR